MVTREEVVDAVEILKGLLETAYLKYGMDGGIPEDEFLAILAAAETHQHLLDTYMAQGSK